MAHDKILILDFGSQVTQLIARRVREAHVYCEVHPCDIGDEWVRAGKSVALAVPSVLSASEMNFLLNPRHPDFKQIKISKPVEFRFDSRLLNR